MIYVNVLFIAVLSYILALSVRDNLTAKAVCVSFALAMNIAPVCLQIYSVQP